MQMTGEYSYAIKVIMSLHPKWLDVFFRQLILDKVLLENL